MMGITDYLLLCHSWSRSQPDCLDWILCFSTYEVLLYFCPLSKLIFINKIYRAAQLTPLNKQPCEVG